MLVHHEEKCVGCGRCQTFCPRNALRAWGYLHIDHERSSECFGGVLHLDENPSLEDSSRAMDRSATRWSRLCVENCPAGAISWQED